MAISMDELNKWAQKAVECDQRGHIDDAIQYYKKTAQLMIHLIESGALADEQYKSAVDKYISRARFLMARVGGGTDVPPESSSAGAILSAQRMIDMALGQDEAGAETEAVRLYTETAEFCIAKGATAPPTASFITTQRGANKLLYDGHAYLKHKEWPNGKTYWRCETKTKCHGFAIAAPNNGPITVTKLHNHAPSSPTSIEVQAIKHCIRTAAVVAKPMTPTRAIIDGALAGSSQAAKARLLPELQNLQKTADRRRKNCKSLTDHDAAGNSDKLRSLALLALDRAEALKHKLDDGNAVGGTDIAAAMSCAAGAPTAPALTDEDDEWSINNNNMDNKTKGHNDDGFINDMAFPRVPTDAMSLLTLHHSSDGPSASSHGVTVPSGAGAAPSSTPQMTPKTRRRWSAQKDDGALKGVDKLEASEVRVLFTTSRINTRTYVPFIKECDLQEPFILAIPYSDKDGLLKLSEKQRKMLKGWQRPDQFMADPKVIERIDSGTIKQTIVTDCSFVASLAVCARFENRFGTRLITNIIYPQNRNGEPVHNPCGKYMVKLHINGIWRKVIIDDFLPVGHNDELLCSHSQHRSELWVSLLEKAYMKVMGGYDFPGSNSSIDLNALTGWIPERIPIRTKEEGTFDADKTFERLFSHFHQGHCLITLATGRIDEAEQQRTGLVDAHAYAVLDLRKVDGKRLFLLKNPWTHLRWKGRFSEKDTASWSAELCAKLDYNPRDAQQIDDGIFWVDYASICAFFDVFYVNWSPALFPFRHALHSSWDAGKGPVKDLYTVGDNPQYILEVNNRHGTASVWILLSRHITEKDDFADNREYITVMVYKNEGKRVYLPFDLKPILEGTRINSPHYLCQLIIREPGIQRYTLVIAQYEKMKTIHYSLRVYSSAEFRCGNMQMPYKFHKKETAEWRGPTAGGCGNGASQATYQNNPLFHVCLDGGSDDNALLVELRGPKEFSVGVELALVSPTRAGRNFERQDSGPFRPGFTVLQLAGLPAGIYSIRPMTFLAAQEGPFILRVDSSCEFELKRVQ